MSTMPEPVLTSAFEAWNLDEIKSAAREGNTGAQRYLEKIGESESQ